MEHLTIWGPHRYNIAMHWDDYGPDHKSIGTGKIYFQPDKDGFVTAGLLWTPGSAVYYCNGKEVARWEDPRISNVPAYMIVYMPTGGWDNNTLDGAGLPDDLVIDYVRCWQRKDLASRPMHRPRPLPARPIATLLNSVGWVFDAKAASRPSWISMTLPHRRANNGKGGRVRPPYLRLLAASELK